MSKILRKGRLIYIDPNDTSNSVTNTIYPYEEYNMFATLTVSIPKRDRSNKDDKVYEVSFIAAGTSGELTTNYTNIDYSNLENNTHECLGVENISISYNSWMFPEVTIKFIDIRGASLFGPQEQKLYQDDMQGEYLGKNAYTSFFHALFLFPYPTFTLRVKGFYGKSATYNLSVSDFKGEFNSSSGNFEATVKFIGSMYGIYNDIPLTFLSVAPYMSYEGRSYWQSSNFKFDEYTTNNQSNGASIPTFPEFLRKISKPNVEDNQAKQVDATELNNVIVKINKLNALKLDFFELIDKEGCFNLGHTYDSNKNYLYGLSTNALEELTFDGIILNKIKTSLYNYFSDLKFNYSTDDLHKDKTVKYNLYKPDYVLFEMTVNEFNEMVSSHSSLNNTFESYFHYKYDNADIQPDWYIRFKNTSDRSIPYDVFKNAIIKNEPKRGSIYAYKIDFINEFYQSILKKEKELAIEKENWEAIVNAKKDEILKSALGFKHSIYNIFKMAFAHMDTFIHCFYKCIDNITSTQPQNRSLESLRWDKSLTDLNQKYENSSLLPPFTNFYKIDYQQSDIKNAKSNLVREIIWPGDINPNLEEVKLVDSMLDAVDRYQDELKLSGDTIPPTSTTVTNMTVYPTTLYDLIFYDQNPYSYISLVDPDNIWKNMICTFALRYYYFMVSLRNHTNVKDYKNFIQAEVKNFVKANPTLEYNRLTNISKEDISDFITNSTNEKQIYNIGLTYNHPLMFYKDGNKYSYNWGKKNNNRYLPLNVQDVYFVRNEYETEDNHVKYRVDIDNLSGITNVEKYGELLVKGNVELYQKLIVASSSDCGIPFDEYVNSFFPNLQMNLNNSELYNEEYSKFDEVKQIPAYSYEKVCTMDSWINKIKKLDIDDISKNNMYGNPPMLNTKNNIFGNYHYYYLNEKEIIPEGESSNPKFYDDIRRRKAYVYLACLNFDNSIMNIWTGKHKEIYFYYNILRDGAVEWYKQNEEETNKTRLYQLLSNTHIFHDIEKQTALQHEQNLLLKMLKESELNNRFGQNHELYRKWALKEFEKWTSLYGDISNNFENIRNYFEIVNVDGSLMDDNEFISFIKEDENIKYLKKNTPYTEVKVMCGKYGDKYAITNIDIEEISYEKGGSPLLDMTELYTYKPVILLIEGMKVMASLNIVDDCDKFIKDVYNYYERNSELVETKKDTRGDRRDREIALYLVLKNLYDKWLAGSDEKKWRLDNENSDFNRFIFVDSLMRDIGQNLGVNVENVANIIDMNTPLKDNTSNSLYGYLASICEKNGCMLKAMPIYEGLQKCVVQNNSGYNYEIIAKNIFEPEFSCDYETEDRATFICLYPGAPSEVLDIADDNGRINYSNDGMDVYEDEPEDILFSGEDTDSYLVPAFVVDYGKQNQSYFKSISVNMNDPIVTEASIKTTMAIAAMGNDGANQVILGGQDLYRVYSTYSYTCNVEMMGDVQIMPLMYFQLSHIPLFHGLYQIIKVEHEIKAGSMITKFTGVRVKRENIRFNNDLTKTFLSNISLSGQSNELSFDTDADLSTLNEYNKNYPPDSYSNTYYSGDTTSISKENTRVADLGLNWQNWRMYLPEISTYKNPINFEFTRSVFNRMRYYNSIYDKKSYICAGSVRNYVECCCHVKDNSNVWHGGHDKYTGNALVKYGYKKITENSKYITDNEIILDLLTESGRTEYTNKYAKNGDVALLIPSMECTGYTKNSSKVENGNDNVGHTCMFIDDSNGSYFKKKLWMADRVYTHENGLNPYSCNDGLMKLEIYRHGSLIKNT